MAEIHLNISLLIRLEKLEKRNVWNICGKEYITTDFYIVDLLNISLKEKSPDK